jgi:hypothetical protein
VRESLLDSEQHWLTPSEEPMAQKLSLEIESLAGSMQTNHFQLGSGGCCFSSDRSLIERKTVDLSVQFTKENLRLNAQVTVRWSDEKTAQSGVSFDYLEPDCREWVIGAMRRDPSRSFIPQGRSYPCRVPIEDSRRASI